MPLTLVDVSTLTTPLSVVRIWALLTGCLTFSLVASTSHIWELPKSSDKPYLVPFRSFCIFTWCFFFVLTFLVFLFTFLSLHSLLPISWKNLTVTVAGLATLMCLAATLAFPWLIMMEGDRAEKPKEVAAAVGSSLTFLAYVAEVNLIRCQGVEQRGYMASVPGLLKLLQVFGGCITLPLMGLQREPGTGWQTGVLATAYALCLLVSLSTVLVMLGDCASRCPLPFDRLLAGFNLLGVLLYMVVVVICFTKVLGLQKGDNGINKDRIVLVVSETVIASATLLAYTVDLAFSVKLLLDRT